MGHCHRTHYNKFGRVLWEMTEWGTAIEHNATSLVSTVENDRLGHCHRTHYNKFGRVLWEITEWGTAIEHSATSLVEYCEK